MISIKISITIESHIRCKPYSPVPNTIGKGPINIIPPVEMFPLWTAKELIEEKKIIAKPRKHKNIPENISRVETFFSIIKTTYQKSCKLTLKLMQE